MTLEQIALLVTAVATIVLAVATYRLVLTTRELVAGNAAETAVLKEQLAETRKANAALTAAGLQVSGIDPPIFYRTEVAGVLRPWVLVRLQNIGGACHVWPPEAVSGCRIDKHMPRLRLVTGAEYDFAVVLPNVEENSPLNSTAVVRLPLRGLMSETWSSEHVLISVVGDGDARPYVTALNLERFDQPVEQQAAEHHARNVATFYGWRSEVAAGSVYARMAEVIRDLPGPGAFPSTT